MLIHRAERPTAERLTPFFFLGVMFFFALAKLARIDCSSPLSFIIVSGSSDVCGRMDTCTPLPTFFLSRRGEPLPLRSAQMRSISNSGIDSPSSEPVCT